MRANEEFTHQNGLALGALGAELEKLLVVNVAEQLLIVVPAEPDEHDACVHRKGGQRAASLGRKSKHAIEDKAWFQGDGTSAPPLCMQGKELTMT
jgi:hypothetical protein